MPSPNLFDLVVLRQCQYLLKENTSQQNNLKGLDEELVIHQVVMIMPDKRFVGLAMSIRIPVDVTVKQIQCLLILT